MIKLPNTVSGNVRPRDREPKFSQSQKPKGLAVISVIEQEDSTWVAVSCSCGAAKMHKRKKVAEDWAERHVNKRHRGRAIWK